jgi:hypothetical protein
MSVQRRVNWISQQRCDLPDLRAIESATSNDFDQLIETMVTASQGYVMRGFNVLMANAIGNAASSLELLVDPGALLHINASQSGTILQVPTGTPNQQLNAATNTNVVGSFSPSSINYVTVDYLRFADDATSAQVYIWDPTTNTETTENAPRAIILEYVINIGTATPTPNLLPLAIVTTDAGNNVLDVEDARWMLCRLGTGGTNPNPFYTYPWPQGRDENPSSSGSDSSDPFFGGDKAIGDLKTWMNAVMSVLLEIKGTTYWYSPLTLPGSLTHLREDAINTIITGSGNISHGILPNSIPVLVTTGNTVFNSNQITGLASTAGLAAGQFIFGSGIPPQTTILSISGTTITMSQNAAFSGSTVNLSFYLPAAITAPGQINWDKTINIRVIGTALDYTIAPNPTSTDITLADDQVAYINLMRDQSITPNLVFTNGSAVVTSVGAVVWTTNLLPGDFIRLFGDSDDNYYEILSVDSLTQVTLTTTFTGNSTGASGAQAVYAFGSYLATATPTTNRDIFISSRETVPFSSEAFWLFAREDDGGPPKVYIRLLGYELENGEDENIGGGISNELLKYIGSPSASASAPQYVSALNPGSVQQITDIATGAGSAMAASQYFFISSSADARTYEVYVNLDGTGTPTMTDQANEYLEWAVLSSDTAAQTAAKLAIVLAGSPNRDFTTTVSSNTVVVTNQSAGACTAAVNNNVGGLTITVTQTGTGEGNFNIQDGDSLTLAIKELDDAIGAIVFARNSNYEETVTIVASGATPPTSLNGPVAANTVITLPNNTRNGDTAEFYIVNSAKLEVFLNGQLLVINDDYVEVGAVSTPSQQIQILRSLLVGDILEFTVSAAGGAVGPAGPAGPTGPTGPPGHDAAGGPVNISTKSSNYTVMLTDNALLANCTSGPLTFTLPPSASATGHVFYFKKIDGTANAMIIMGNGSELIDGANTLTTTTQYEAFTLITDGTQFWVF